MRPHRSLRPRRDPRSGRQLTPARRARSGRLGPALAFALTLVLVAGSGALAGCGAGSHASASPSPSALSDAQLLDIGRQFSQCVRDHGVANFPDPVINDGHIALPADSTGADAKQALGNNPAAEQACKSIMDRVPPDAHKNATPSAQELQGLLQYAQCMRSNGIPEWPDPLPDGSFPLPTPLEQEGKSQRVLNGMHTCDHFLGDKTGISVK